MAHAGNPSAPQPASESLYVDTLSRFRRVTSIVLAALAGLACAACAAGGATQGIGQNETFAQRPFDEVAGELEAMSIPFLGPRGHPETFRAILADTIDKDAYLCMPSPRALFFGDASVVPDGERVIRGVMPHYGFFFGPMSYLVRRRAGRWEVSVRVAVDQRARSA